MGKVFNSDSGSHNILGADAVRAQRVKAGQATRAKNVKIAAHTKKGVNKGSANYHKISEGLYKPKPDAASKKKGQSYTKNPARKSFWSKSVPALLDWTGDAGEAGMIAAHDGVDDLGPAVKDYGKHMANSLDFGLDFNEGDYIVALEDYDRENDGLDKALRIGKDALAASGVAGFGGVAGGTGAAIAAGLAGRRAAGAAAQPAASKIALSLSDDAPKPSPARVKTRSVYNKQDTDELNALIRDLGLFPDAAPAASPARSASVVVPDHSPQVTFNYRPGNAGGYSGPRGANGAYQSRNMATPYPGPYPKPVGPRGPGRGRAFRGDSIRARMREEYRRFMENEMAAQGPYGDYDNFDLPFPQGTIFD